MADRFVYLQHHLVGHEEDVRAAGRTVRRRQKLQRLRREPAAATHEIAMLKAFESALLRIEEAASLRLGLVIRRDMRGRDGITELLVYFSAPIREIDLFD